MIVTNRLRTPLVLLALMAASCAGQTVPSTSSVVSSSSTTTTDRVEGTGAPSTQAPSPQSTDAPTTTTSAPSTTSLPPTPLGGVTIVLDPGHNGMNWAHPEEINRQVDIGTGTKACNTTGTSTTV